MSPARPSGRRGVHSFGGLFIYASVNRAKAQAIVTRYQSMLTRVADLMHSEHAARAVEFLFRVPVFATTIFSVGAGTPRKAAERFIPLLRKARIPSDGWPPFGNCPAIVAVDELVEITDGGSVQ